MAYDEEIRVAIIATADGVVAGTAQATAALDAFQAQLQAAQGEAASAYAASNAAYVAAQNSAAQLLAAGQRASVAQVVAAYDALNIARDANLANAQAYLAALSASQREAIQVEDYAANAAAQSMAEQVIAERANEEAAYENSAAQLEQAAGMDMATASTEAETVAEVENTVAKRVNTGATIGLTEAVAGLARGNLGMAAYGMTRMSVSSGILSAIMSPLGLTIAAVTAVIAGFGVEEALGAEHAHELEGALLATNDAAGLTEDQLQSMASEMAGADTTVGEARDAILGLARAGEYTGQTFRLAAQSVVDFANLTGASTAQATKYVDAMGEATTQQLIKANDQYHFLSLAQFTQIEDLRKEGKAAEATDAIMQAFYAHMHAGAQQQIADQGYLVRAYYAVKRAVSEALTWGEKPGIADKIAHLQGQLRVERAYSPGNTAAIKAIQDQIAALKELEAQKEKTAAAGAAQNNATDNAIAAKYGAGSPHSRAAHDIHLAPLHRESSSGASRMLAEDQRLLDGLQRDADQRERIAAEVNSINENGARRHAAAMLRIHVEQLHTLESEGKISHAQELADEKKLYADEYAAQLAEYQKELALEKGKPVQIARINAEIESLNDAHLQRMAAASESAAKKQAEAFQKALQPITSAFTTSINGIIQGTQTMQMAVGRILDSILLKYLDVAIKSSVQWVASEAEKTMATEVGTVSRVALVEVAEAKTLAIKMLNAAKYFVIAGAEAAVGAFKAMVGIPYVGPVLAVAAAAAAAAEVKSLAHFDTGAWSIPHDMPAMVHAGEMILPPPQSGVLREALSGRGGNGGSMGDVHMHLHTPDAEGARRFFLGNQDALAEAIRGAHRSGAFA